MNIFTELKDIFFPDPHALSPGIFHYMAPPDSSIPYRFHLRIEPGGQGILILNAKTILHLNQTATEFAYYLVSQIPEDEAVKKISRRYRVPKSQALQDYHELIEKLTALVQTIDLDPETFLDIERRDPYTERLTAPYRLDCALTYQISSDQLASATPLDRVKRELSTEEWKSILHKSWEVGIPHIIFTGGEPTLRPDLPELIALSQEIGQVTGLLTDGFRLAETEYLHALLQNGLDHIMLVLQPEESQSWEALRDILVEDIFITVHLTIRNSNKAEIVELIDRLVAMGVKSISLSTNAAEHISALKFAQQTAAERELSLVWDIPVPYSDMNPVVYEIAGQFERAEDEDNLHFAEGAGQAWLYVEPDGDVLAGQGKTDVLGNFLTSRWDEIWKK